MHRTNTYVSLFLSLFTLFLKYKCNYISLSMEHYQHCPIVDNIQSTPEHVHTVFVFMEMGLEARGSQLGEFYPQGTFGDGVGCT